MKKTNFFTIGLSLSLVLILSACAIAQDNQDNNAAGNRGNRGNRPNNGGGFQMMSPERLQEMIMSRATSQMKLDADEAKVIVPKIVAILTLRFSSMQELNPVREELRTAVESSNQKQVKIKIDQLKAKSAALKKKMDAAEKDLESVITIEQQGQLILAGILTDGSSMGGMGFGGPGGPGRMGGGNRGPGGNRGGNNNGGDNNPPPPPPDNN